MPKPYEHLGRGAEFRTKTREDVVAQFMAGYSEEEISERNKLAVADIKAIIKFQSEKDPDAFEKLRKWRQKNFIDQAWNIISVGQDIMLKGLENRSKERKNLTLSSASSAANMVILMIDRIRAMESQTKTREKKFTLTREEKEDVKKAQIRVEEKSSETTETNGK